MLLLTAPGAYGLQAFFSLLVLTSYASARIYNLQDDYISTNFFDYFTFQTVRDAVIGSM